MKPVIVSPFLLILSAFVLIGCTVLIVLLFSGSRKPDNKAYKQQAELTNKALDIIKIQQESNAELRNRLLADKEAAILKADSLLNLVLNNKTKYTTISNAYKEIPGNIDRISNDDDAIRRAFADY